MAGDLSVVLGAGPVGRALVDTLVADGRSVRVVTRSGDAAVPSGVDMVGADLSDPSAAARACEGAGVVYGCVGKDYRGWPEFCPR